MCCSSASSRCSICSIIERARLVQQARQKTRSLGGASPMPRSNPALAAQQPNPMFRIGALVYGRDDILHLEFGEPDFPTPAHISAAAVSSITDERQGYGPGNGMSELRAAVAERVQRVNGFAPTAGQVVMTAGGTGGLMGSLLTLC